MPRFADSTDAAAPPEEVWKLLYDPSRFPEWWAGIESVAPGRDGGDFTVFPDGYPDFPMPQQLETHREDHSVKISCLVSDLRFEWHLEELEGGRTRISLDVEIPEHEAHRLDDQRDVASRSLRKLASLASAR
jgi:uncharacterized protein YndB with AHSA1/START domain